MNVIIEKIEFENLHNAFALIEEVFDQFVAPDYTEVGIKTFKEKILYNEAFKKKFAEGKEIMYGAYWNEELVGCISTSCNHTLSCLFVKESHQRKGIGTLLYKYILKVQGNSSIERVRLNAAPYAVPFYKSLGFKSVGSEVEYEGMKYTPMEICIKNKD